MFELSLFSAISASMIITYLFEMRQHCKNLKKIPIRIHVNGTRGKSSLTRLIAAGLRAGGVRTLAKTTGTLAQIIYPDGAEKPIRRFGKPNIIEQIEVVRTAVVANADAIVIECMALAPKLQALSESRLIQSTHGVITNVRADHLEVMGPSKSDVAKALSSTVPQKGTLFTSEKTYLNFLSKVAQERKSHVFSPCNKEDEVSTEDLAGFPYVEHSDNVALALLVCRQFGIGRKTALQAMWKCQSDVGAMKFYRQRHARRNLIFANAFAANDPFSSEQLWKLAFARYCDVKFKVVMVNCRADRSVRSKQLAETIFKWRGVDLYLVVGQHTQLFAKLGRSLGVPHSKMEVAEGCLASDIVVRMEKLANPHALVVGVGNIAGVGMDLLDLLNRSWEFAS